MHPPAPPPSRAHRTSRHRRRQRTNDQTTQRTSKRKLSECNNRMHAHTHAHGIHIARSLARTLTVFTRPTARSAFRPWNAGHAVRSVGWLVCALPPSPSMTERIVASCFCLAFALPCLVLPCLALPCLACLASPRLRLLPRLSCMFFFLARLSLA
jgi:hypothetical protein